MLITCSKSSGHFPLHVDQIPNSLAWLPCPKSSDSSGPSLLPCPITTCTLPSATMFFLSSQPQGSHCRCSPVSSILHPDIWMADFFLPFCSYILVSQRHFLVIGDKIAVFLYSFTVQGTLSYSFYIFTITDKLLCFLKNVPYLSS
jgi:hypothetical protein